MRTQLHSFGGSDPIWGFVNQLRAERFTGSAQVGTDPRLRLFAVDGRIYFAERDGDAPLGARLVNFGVLSATQLERGSVKVGDIVSLARLFHRDPTIDRDAVELTIEMATEKLLETVALQPVGTVAMYPLRHHPSGIHLWSRELPAPVYADDDAVAAPEVAAPEVAAPEVTAPEDTTPVVAATPAPVEVDRFLPTAPAAPAIDLTHSIVAAAEPTVEMPSIAEPEPWAPTPAPVEPAAVEPEPWAATPASYEPAPIEPVTYEPEAFEPAPLTVAAFEPAPAEPAAFEPAPAAFTPMGLQPMSLGEPVAAATPEPEAAPAEPEPTPSLQSLPAFEAAPAPEPEPEPAPLLRLSSLQSLTSPAPEPEAPAPVAAELDEPAPAPASETVGLMSLGSLSSLTAEPAPAAAPEPTRPMPSFADLDLAASLDDDAPEPAPAPAPTPTLASAPIPMATLRTAASAHEATGPFGGPTHNLAAVEIWEMVDEILDDQRPAADLTTVGGEPERRGRGWLRGRKG